MTTPTFTLPTSGSDPKRATKEGLEENINQIIQYLDDMRIRGDAAQTTGLNFQGPWDASTELFPLTNLDGDPVSKGDFFWVSVEGTFGGETYSVNEPLVAVVDSPSTSDIEDWYHAPVEPSLLPIIERLDAMAVPFDTVADFFAATLADIKAAANATTGFVYVTCKDINVTYLVDLVQAATDYNVTTTAGVEAKVLQGAASQVSILAFGATGLEGDDQNAAIVAADESKLPIYIPAGVYEYSTPLVLTAPWVGVGKGQGNYGSAIDADRALETARLVFSGTGYAVTTRSTFRHIAVVSDAVTVGQSGVKLLGAAIGQAVGPIRVMEFDGTSIEIGGSTEESGIFFADLSGLEATNQTRVGDIGIHVIGGGASSSNANIFTGTFVSGAFTVYQKVQGNNNLFFNADVNPKPSFVTGLGGAIDAGVIIEGDGNTFINPYFEPTPNENDLYDCLVRFTSGASGNDVQRLYTPSAGPSIDVLIEDLGTANSLTVAQIGENFTASRGTGQPSQNLIPNSSWAVETGGNIPFGWKEQPGATGTITIDETVSVGGGPRSLKMVTAGTKMQVHCYLNSATAMNTQNSLRYYGDDFFKDKTITVMVPCLSSTEGVGAVKVTGGSGAQGTASHSGSGNVEILTARTRVSDLISNKDVSITLRSNTTYTDGTGTCWFGQPVLVIGNDVPRYGNFSYIDAANPIFMGRVQTPPAIDLVDGESAIDVSLGDTFVSAQTALTQINAFDNKPTGGVGQRITIIPTDGNTRIAKTGSIRPVGDLTRTLAAYEVVHFEWIESLSKWIEV